MRLGSSGLAVERRIERSVRLAGVVLVHEEEVLYTSLVQTIAYVVFRGQLARVLVHMQRHEGVGGRASWLATSVAL